MAEIRAAIAAAGKGTRAGLDYPKTLHPVGGRAILLRLIDLLAPYDPAPAVVVSPQGRAAIAGALQAQSRAAQLIEQPRPRGMGDAVLRLAALRADHIVLAWGDLPLICPETVSATVQAHLDGGHDFTFPTRHVDEAYTLVRRDGSGAVIEVIETREWQIPPAPGERDIGLFAFRSGPVLAALAEDLPGKYGAATGEHGFLYVIGHLAARGLAIRALPIARDQDLATLNTRADMERLRAC